MQPVSKENEPSYQFDAFELDPVRRLLLRGGKAIALKPKVFETLLVLVRNSGRVMDKDELMQQVWPDTVVEEVNLAHNISVLRKALGQKAEENRFIITMPGRGYSFVAEVTQRNASASTAVTEYELTRSRLVIEEETDDKDLPNKLRLKSAGEDTRLLPGRQPEVNISRPWERKRFVLAAAMVGLVMVIGVGLLIYNTRLARPPRFAQIKSIAVLPFKPLIADSRDESLEIGMADSLIARLSNIRDINVRPVSAVRKYAGMEQDAVAAGREQRVDAVLDGQIQKSGEKIRVTVRMVRVADGAWLWSSQFDETTTDIFRVQDSISERVVGVLALKLSSEERARLTNRDTENTDAYQLFMIGRFHYAKRTKDAISKSIAYYEQAIEKDPQYALAYAALAASYSTSGWYGFLPPQQAYTKAKEAATKSLEIDSTVAEAHAVLGNVKRSYDWDWAGAEREYKRAIELDPNYATAYHWYGDHLAYLGRFDESLASFKRAQEIDPVSLIINSSIGDTLVLARRYDQAIEQYQRVLQMDPSFADAHSNLGGAYLHKNNYPEAMSELLKGDAASGRSSQDVAALRTAYETSGMRGYWQKLIELKKRPSEGYVSPYDMAFFYAALGERNLAFDWLEKAYRERDPAMIMIKVAPIFDDIRSDPRFTDLLRRVGLS